jgi:acyl carrier protein
MDQNNTVEARVKRILAAQFGIGEDIDSAKTLADLGADSLDQIEIVLAVEEEFELDVFDEDGEKLVGGTVAQAIAYIQGRLQ